MEVLHGAAISQSATVFRAARTDFRNQKTCRRLFQPTPNVYNQFSFARLKFAALGNSAVRSEDIDADFQRIRPVKLA